MISIIFCVLKYEVVEVGVMATTNITFTVVNGGKKGSTQVLLDPNSSELPRAAAGVFIRKAMAPSGGRQP